jgi:hypothetical protein
MSDIPVSDARSERARAKAMITDGNAMPSDFAEQFEAGFDTSRDSFGLLQADRLDDAVPVSTDASTPTSEGRVHKEDEDSLFNEVLKLLSSM